MALPLREWLAIQPGKNPEHRSPRPIKLASSLFRDTNEDCVVEFIVSQDIPRARPVVVLANIDFVRRTGTPHFELQGSVLAIGGKKPDQPLLFETPAYDPYRRIGVIKIFKDPNAPKEVADIEIEELKIGVRAYNGLKRIGIQTIGDLTQKSEHELEYIPKIGKATIREIQDALTPYGVGLREPAA